MVLQTAGIGMVAVPPAKLDRERLAAFRDALRAKGIDTSRWGVSGAKTVEHLFWEAYQQEGCIITGVTEPGAMKRVTRLVKIRLVAEIFGVDHTLFSRLQFMHDGQTNERRQVPLKKLTWHGMRDKVPDNDLVYSENCPYTEDWRTGVTRALDERLGLTEKWQQQHLEEDASAYSYHTEDNVQSDGYPGLNTLYCIHDVTFRIVQPEHAGVQCIGLPHGQEFATAEGDFNFSMQNQEDGLAIGTQLNIWTWARNATSTPVPSARREPSPAKPGGRSDSVDSGGDARVLIKRVPLPAICAQALTEMRARMARQGRGAPSAALCSAMEGQAADWGKVRQMARRIAEPEYTLRDFNRDLDAFPELSLYLLDGERRGSQAQHTNSGRTIGDEYQRTVGAFFAIYWLMRLHVDGKDGFAFGVDEDWVPVRPETAERRQLRPADKRLAFREQGRWDNFTRLLVDAGLMRQEGGGVSVCEVRLVSLLALTAIHDIMKMDLILPQVQEEHSPYHGYSAGDTIGDHDHALGYVMDHYPGLLPSFRGLDSAERLSVQFTQCNLQFNHGWFVQAEGPPGAILTKFREVLIRDHKSQIKPRDIALYFVHWLTDLAGAEPTPLGGCEKFVVKFPLAVLNSFLRSFEYVERIAESTETEVMESYLKMRWQENELSPGPVPTGDSAVAKMRLLCMAQTNALPVLHGFAELPEEDREILSTEMARTGCIGQSYSADIVPPEVRNNPVGPAFLVYYGPAFLQNMGMDRPVVKVSMLAEIYRSARALWPAQADQVGQSVTVRIDCIKDMSVADMRKATLGGDVWLIVKHNESEAFVERSSQRKLNKFINSRQQVQILDFHTVTDQNQGDGA